MKRLIKSSVGKEVIPLWKHDQGMIVEGSEWSDELETAGGKTAAKVRKIVEAISGVLEKQQSGMFPELYGIDLDYAAAAGPRSKDGTIKYNYGNMKQHSSFELIFTLYSDIKKIDGRVLSIQFNREWGQVRPDVIVDKFAKEYEDFIEFSNIDVSNYRQ